MDTAVMTPTFDRTVEDLGNIVELGHVNVRVPDQSKAIAFYLMGLGLTRDPYLMAGLDNMWVNVGRGQFHLPTGGPEVVRGTTALVMPDLDALLKRLRGAKKYLEGTKFSFREAGDTVEATCPWGNRIRVHAPGPVPFRRHARRHAVCRVRYSRRHRPRRHRQILHGNHGRHRRRRQRRARPLRLGATPRPKAR